MEYEFKFVLCFLALYFPTLMEARVMYDCPSGWVEYELHCYQFVFYPTHARTQASAACQVDGAYLLSVNSAKENEFVVKWLMNNDQNKANIWWTSGVGQGSEMRWEGDGSLMSTTADMWNSEQDMISTENGLYVAYAYSVVASTFKYTRQRIGAQHPYVCEISLREAYRIIQQERDHMFGTSITDPNLVVFGPRFIQQPKSLLTMEPTDEISVECVANSNPNPSYVWYRLSDSGEATEVTSNSYYIITNGKITVSSPKEQRDEGAYQCLAFNEKGAILSDPIRMNFGYLFEFSNDPPGSVTALMYQGTVISCQFPPYNPGVFVRWYKENGGPNFMRTDLQEYIMMSNNGKLYFSETSRMDAGYYHCFVALMAPVGQVLSSAQLPSRTSLGIQLIVTEELALDYGPEIHNDFPAVFPFPSLRGETLTLECFAYGRLPMTYTWFRDGGAVPAKSGFLEQNRWLVLPDAQFEDSGNYTCRVERGSSAVEEKTLHLVIEARPFFIFPLKDQHVDIAQQFTWRCEALGKPPPTYTWYKNGKKLTSVEGDVEIHINMITIYSADPEKHQGMYQCEASNVYGTTFSSAQLRVLSFAPCFMRRPVNPSQYGTAGGLVTILCQPEAAPPPDITWKKDGNDLLMSEDGHVTQLANGNLLIKDLQLSDQGMYTCIATNTEGTASSSGVLSVLSQTIINIAPADTRVEVNNTAFLACQASFDVKTKDLIYVWDLNGRVLDIERELHYMLGAQGTIPGLYIVNAQLYHTGRYHCSATTVDYATSREAYLEVLGPPGECAGVHAKVIDSNLTLSWTLGPANGAPITMFHIQFNTNFNKKWRLLRESVQITDVIDVAGSMERYELLLSGLKPGSSYRFRIIAVNRYGVGPPSQPSVLYKIPDAAPVVPVTGIRAGWGPVGTLPVVWDHLDEEDLTGPGVGYRLYWRNKDGTNNEGQWSMKIIEGRVNNYTPLVGADNYYLKYEIIVGTFNSFGLGPNSSITTIMSAEDMPVGAPSKVYADAYNATAMLVHWTPVPNTREFIRGRIQGYQVTYWSQTLTNPEYVGVNIHCDCSEGLIVGLDPNEDYWMYVQVFTAAGLGPNSGDGEGSTYIFPPLNYPEFVHVTSYPGNSVFVHWRGVSTGLLEEPIIGYKIRWWPATENIKQANDTIVPSKMTHGIIKGVDKGTVYALRVLAYSAGGDGKKSPTVFFTLEGEVMINPETTEIMNSSRSFHNCYSRHLFLCLLVCLLFFYMESMIF